MKGHLLKKKIFAALLAAVAGLMLTAGPALATPTQHSQNCATYSNNDHSKKIKVCTELEQSDVYEGTYWARTEVKDVPGAGEPFAVQVFTDYFSSQNFMGPWCPGAAPACNTDPTEKVFLDQPLDGQQSNTEHLPYFARYCYNETHATVLVYYNSTQYGQGNPADVDDLVSSPVYNTNFGGGGWCILP
jgi:hypothetical protein